MLRLLLFCACSATLVSAQVRTPPPPPPPPAPPAARVRPAPPLPPLPPVEALRARELQLDAERLRDHLINSIDVAAIRDQAATITSEAMDAARIAASAAFADARLFWGDGQSPAPVASRHPQDPADSLFMQARALLNRGDYRAASVRFKELQDKHPQSAYIPDAMYWQAWALYRIGGMTELREATTILDRQRERFPRARIAGDAATLATRIRGALAARGDASAGRAVAEAAAAGQGCDTEDQSVRVEALSALNRTDPEAAAPLLERILARRDECSARLRSAALVILGRRDDAKSVATLMTVARSDPSAAMRTEAITWLARRPSDAVLGLLENLAKTEPDANVRRAAARGLIGYPSPRATQAVRALIEDAGTPDALKTELLSGFTAERMTADDATWLRTVYTRSESSRVKQAIIGAIARFGGDANQRWLMEVASSEQESTSLRASAFSRVAATMTVAQLSQAYDNAAARNLRESALRALAQRKEPAAADKLLDVVRRGTDPQLRTLAISLLSAKKDPKITAALLDLIDR